MKAKPEHFGKIHLVFDVENLSCMTNGHLLSFACVMFHADEGWMEHVSFSLKQERGKPNGHIDPDTVKWWIMQALQNPEAAMETFNITRPDDDTWSIDDAAFQFGKWLGEILIDYVEPYPEKVDFARRTKLTRNGRPDYFAALDLQVWGHAPRVDILQLEKTLFGGEGKGPWDFRQENDTRTLMKRWSRLRPGEGGLWELADAQAEVRCPLAQHTAIRDAYRQAYMVIIDHGWLERFPRLKPEHE